MTQKIDIKRQIITYGREYDLQNIPVITRRQRENETNYREHQQLRHKTLEQSKSGSNNIMQTWSEPGTIKMHYGMAIHKPKRFTY